MKIADPSQTPNDFLADHYARILRVIGQNLANLLPVALEVEAMGSVYLVHGHCTRERLEGKTNRTKSSGLGSLVKKFVQEKAGVVTTHGTDSVTFDRTYGQWKLSDSIA